MYACKSVFHSLYVWVYVTTLRAKRIAGGCPWKLRRLGNNMPHIVQLARGFPKPLFLPEWLTTGMCIHSSHFILCSSSATCQLYHVLVPVHPPAVGGSLLIQLQDAGSIGLHCISKTDTTALGSGYCWCSVNTFGTRCTQSQQTSCAMECMEGWRQCVRLCLYCLRG